MSHICSLSSNAYMIERINGIPEKSGRFLNIHPPTCSRQEPEHKPSLHFGSEKLKNIEILKRAMPF